jgi:mRNA-degrading endonuclease RelE of RelBE toxin-antitoxin system
MRLRLTQRARKDYASLPIPVRRALAKQLEFLLIHIGHPSLHAKKYSEALDLWQGRVTRDWRFYFKIERDEYVVLSITPHPK